MEDGQQMTWAPLGDPRHGLQIHDPRNLGLLEQGHDPRNENLLERRDHVSCHGRLEDVFAGNVV